MLRFAATLLLLTCTTVAQAATIQVAPLDSSETAVVTIEGALEYSDIEQFQTKTSNLTKAIVMFGSDGGNLAAGIDIGTAIRLKGFWTFVPDGVRCASACALAWLGGQKRLMGNTAFVGFHAAYVVKDGESSETSTGNALVGAYLNRIGLPDRAVVYITQAAPNDMTWLNLADAARQGIDVELFTPDAKATATSGQREQGPAVQPTQALTAEETGIADRLVANFSRRYKEAGLAGLNVSIGACYDQVRVNRLEASAKYCMALDLLTSQFDLEVTKALKVNQMEFNKYASAYSRALSIATAAGFQVSTADLITRAGVIASSALGQFGSAQSQSSIAATSGVVPSLSGLRIGNPLSQVTTIGLTPVAKNQTGPFTVMKWAFPDGNELSVTASSNGVIDYVESDWGERQAGTVTDFPGLIYGKTTLSELRQMFGSNGFAFAQHGGAVKVKDGVVMINSYEVGSIVATFVTKISGNPSRSQAMSGDAVLVALSIADPGYANSVWGARTYDQAYHPIEWK
jgi:hypothetical protein